MILGHAPRGRRGFPMRNRAPRVTAWGREAASRSTLCPMSPWGRLCEFAGTNSCRSARAQSHAAAVGSIAAARARSPAGSMADRRPTRRGSLLDPGVIESGVPAFPGCPFHQDIQPRPRHRADCQVIKHDFAAPNRRSRHRLMATERQQARGSNEERTSFNALSVICPGADTLRRHRHCGPSNQKRPCC